MDQDSTIRPESNNRKSGNQDDSDKTIRPGSEEHVHKATNEDKTIRPPDSDATIRPGEQTISSGMQQEEGATVRPDAEVIGSGVKEQTDDATIRAGEDEKEMPVIQSFEQTTYDENTFILHNEEFRKVKVLSEATGEAQIYLIEKNNKQTVLKLYYPSMKPKKELINKIAAFDHPHIIKVFDHGDYKDPALGGASRYFERMEFAPGDTLDKDMPIKEPERLRTVAYNISGALAYCHKNGIIHKDIKPGNLFYRDRKGMDIIIGDFGISSLFDEEQMMHMTTQARSAIFAAPEQYQAVDGQVIIGPEVDFYALGITMMYLWLGDNPFKGIPERSMMRAKNDGLLAYPEDMPQDILTLTEGLTVLDRQKRWGFEEVKRWYNGEQVEVHRETIQVEYKPFPFDVDANLVAHSPEEMAKLLMKEPKLGKRYLYRGKITNWLEESNKNKLAMEIEEITEKVWPANEDAGLRAAIYTLHPGLPYTAVDNTVCHNDEDISKILYLNFNTYVKNLQRPDDDLYIFYWSNGLSDLVNEFQSYFKKYEPEIALLSIIYSLNPNYPFYVTREEPDKKGRKMISCETTEEIARAFVEHDLTEESYASLNNGRLNVWLRYRKDQIMADKVEEISNNGRPPWSRNLEIIYTLKPDLGIYRIIKENDETHYNYSPQDVGQVIAWHLPGAYEYGNETSKNAIKKDLEDPDGEINCYMRARGWYDYIKYRDSCYDGELHSDKIGPYNTATAAYKVAKALIGEANPAYYFSADHSEFINTPEELESISRKKVADALDNGILKDWLSIFFHEDPYLKEAEVYERKLGEYLDYIGKLNSSDENVTRFKKAKSKFLSVISKNKAIDRFYIISRIVLPILMAIPALISIYILFKEGIPMIENPLSGKFWQVTWVYYAAITVPFAIWMWYEEDFSVGCVGGIMGGVVTGIVLYYLGYLALEYLAPYVAYISMGVIALVLAGLTRKALHNPYTNKAIRKKLFTRSEELSLYEPLRFAFDTSLENFQSSKTSMIKQYGKERKHSMKRLWVYSLLGIVLFVGILGSIILFHPAYADFNIQEKFRELTASKGQEGAVMGTWEGSFEGRKAVLNITGRDNNQLEGTIRIYYKTPVTQTLKGSLDPGAHELVFIDQKDISFKGSYQATINDAWNKIEGEYTLAKTGGKFPFEFYKASDKKQKKATEKEQKEEAQ